MKFPNDSEVLTVQADTEDNKCAFISVQNNSVSIFETVVDSSIWI